MIKHFLKRDFKDSIVSWVILSLISILFVPVCLTSKSENALWLLGYFYFMFPIFQIPTLIGSITRNDHMMSRHYYLSLPRSRDSLFYLIVFRMGIFFLPLWSYLVLVFPWVLSAYWSHLDNALLAYGIYFFGISMGFVWFISSAILHSIFLEQSMHFSSSRKRILSALVPVAIGALEFLVFGFCFTYVLRLVTGMPVSFQIPQMSFLVVLICFAVPTAITGFTLKLARARWTSSR